MNEIYLLMMSAFLEVVIVYQLFNHFFEKKAMPKWKSVLISTAVMIIIMLVSLLKQYHLNTIMLLFIMAVYARLLFKCKTAYALFTSIVFVMIGMVAEIGTGFGVSFVLDIDTIRRVMSMDYKIIVYLISNSLVFWIVRVIIATIPSEKQNEVNKSQLYLVIFPAFAILNEFLLVYLLMRFEVERQIFFFCMVVGIGLIYAGLLLIMVYEQGIQKCVLENELRLARQKEEANETFYHLQERNLEEVRAVMHDFKKQLLHLQEMYGTRDTEAEQYHQALMQTLESQIRRQAIDLNNKVLSSILQRAQIYCEQLQISFNFKSEIYDFGFLTPLDTSTIFDNAIDNAIEACSKMDAASAKRLDISIRNTSHFILIEFTNTYSSEPRESDGILLTDKQETSKHGYGVQNIFAAAQKYGGDGMYQYKDGIFQLLLRIQSAIV